MDYKFVLLKDVQLGNAVKIYPFTNLYGCSIGDFTSIGTFVEIQKNVSIGKNCKIQSHTFICDGVEIEDDVFIGHGVMFINDKYPKSVNTDGSKVTEKDWVVVPTYIGKGVSVGSGVTILCGVTIGENALIAAGSVVTKNIPSDEIWGGNPAKFIKRRED